MKVTALEIDALLPQTQCGLCGYGGCMPYAQALLAGAPIHLCPPGGVTTLRELATLLQQDPTPYLSDMELKAKPRLQAMIRESECIGCTKCIAVCPVDAIVGASKQMHTVIPDLCTGCELCVPPCPVDCIDLLTLPDLTAANAKEKANQARQQFLAREERLKKTPTPTDVTTDVTARKDYIAAAISRAKNKRKA